MFYLVAGCTILIEAYDDWSTRAVSEGFSGWFLTQFQTGADVEPDVTIRIRRGATPPHFAQSLPSFQVTHGGICFSDDQTYYVQFGGSLIIFGPGTSREIDLWVDEPLDPSSAAAIQLLSHALSPALRRCGIFEIHSAGVIPPGSDRAIMIAGPSGSGKSTLTSQLAKEGWQYMSDDILLLTNTKETIQVHAFRRFFALTSDTIATVKIRGSVDLGSARKLTKERLAPEEHFVTKPVQQAEPGLIVFPTITGEEKSRLLELTPADTMSRLLRLCPWASYDKPTSLDHLRMLGRLANSGIAFDLLAGRDILDQQFAVNLFQNLPKEKELVH